MIKGKCDRELPKLEPLVAHDAHQVACFRPGD
jgi:hypothetical protein